jgi:hypothetical protein
MVIVGEQTTNPRYKDKLAVAEANKRALLEKRDFDGILFDEDNY